MKGKALEDDVVSPTGRYTFHGDRTGYSEPEATLDMPPGYQEVMALSNNDTTTGGDQNGKIHGREEVHVQTTQEEDKKSKGKDEKTTVEVKKVGLFRLFHFADRYDIILMLVGTICAMGNGCAVPINFVIYGSVADLFISNAINRSISANLSANATAPGVFSQVSHVAIYFCILAACVLVLAYLEISCWCLAAERQGRRIRTLFFHSILKQDIGWFDTHQSGQLNTRLSDDVNSIQNGISDKMATLIQWLSTFVAGYTLGLIKGWKLALVILSVSPLLAACAGFMGKMVQSFTSKEVTAYAQAGAVAEEVLMGIRTVAAFSGEKKESARYNRNLETARKMGVKKGAVSGFGMGFFWVVIFGVFGLSFWYGSKLVREEGYTPGVILQVFFGVLIGSMSLGHAVPNLEAISVARGAAASVFDMIALEPAIDSSSEEGETPANVEGNIEFCDLQFAYPARPDVQVLHGLSLNIKVGQMVALVGPSGCGKSTTVQLIQRFYDPQEGQVKLDGRDIRDLNVRWLRKQIGVVSQEPVLFAMTIAENIRYGADGVTDEDIRRAAKEANAHDFISKLPQKYDTLVGERGAQLSGGQKQRIAIARALVRNPKVLLLDEATSALDTESESVVQAALDKASQGRTTLVIAHRLSTVRNANLIIGIQDGQVVEKGSHDELMQEQGLYYQLVMNQTQRDETEVCSISDGDTHNSSVLHSFMTQPTGAPSTAEEGEDEELEEYDALLDSPLKRSPSVGSRGSRRSLRSRSKSASSMRQMSKVSQAEDEELEEEEEKVEPAPLKRIMRMNATEWPYILIGCFGALFSGSAHPIFAVIFSEILGAFGEPDREKQAALSNMYSGILVAIGVVVGLAMCIQTYCFAVSGERLTMRLRDLSFRAMLRQEIGWFDDRKQQVGILTTKLATDASMVKGATGSQLGVMIQSITNVGTAVIIAFVFGWKLALVVIAFMPIMAVAGMAQTKLMIGFSRGDKDSLEEGGKIAAEAIDNIRTVASLTKEPAFEDRYAAHFQQMFKEGIKKANVYGATYAFTQAVIFFAYAAAFTFGAWLVDQGDMEFKNVFKVFSAIIFGGMAFGRASAFAPDYSKAKVSASKIFELLDKKPEIDSSDPSGNKPSQCIGHMEFDSVKFVYPSRPNVKVLQGLSLRVTSGETLALVGSSGCGKSTTIQLIERFYQPLEGTVKVDGEAIDTLNIQWLRSQIGLVSQEPILFDASIRDNIAYGDNSRDVPVHEIITAARNANIHSFIESLPDGYDTNVGDKGTQLSGGQKQRVAIARALLRNPKILLLDEATSALDTESEKVVQEALDRAQEGRTSIVIAHRLSTVQNADVIAVIHNGQVVEQGSHKELMALRGHYFSLQQVQNRSKKGKAA